MDDPVSPNRLLAGTTETPKFPKFQSSVQGLNYHVDSIHSVMPTLVSVVACVRPALDQGGLGLEGGRAGRIHSLTSFCLRERLEKKFSSRSW